MNLHEPPFCITADLLAALGVCVLNLGFSVLFVYLFYLIFIYYFLLVPYLTGSLDFVFVKDFISFDFSELLGANFP